MPHLVRMTRSLLAVVPHGHHPPQCHRRHHCRPRPRQLTSEPHPRDQKRRPRQRSPPHTRTQSRAPFSCFRKKSISCQSRQKSRMHLGSALTSDHRALRIRHSKTFGPFMILMTRARRHVTVLMGPRSGANGITPLVHPPLIGILLRQRSKKRNSWASCWGMLMHW